MQEEFRNLPRTDAPPQRSVVVSKRSCEAEMQAVDIRRPHLDIATFRDQSKTDIHG